MMHGWSTFHVVALFLATKNKFHCAIPLCRQGCHLPTLSVVQWQVMDSRRMKAKGKKRTPCKILTLFICVTLYLYIHISFRHVMSYSSFCHYTIGVSSETLRPVDYGITKYKIANTRSTATARSADPSKGTSKPEEIPNPATEIYALCLSNKKQPMTRKLATSTKRISKHPCSPRCNPATVQFPIRFKNKNKTRENKKMAGQSRFDLRFLYISLPSLLYIQQTPTILSFRYYSLDI